MALYKYKVVDDGGRVSQLLIEGDSQEDAVRRVQRRGLRPVEFLGEGAATAEAGERFRFGRRRFDVVDFTDRLVPLLEARIPLERALGIVAASATGSYGSRIIEELRKGLHEGRRLSRMLRDRSHLFPEFYATLVEVGEESGALAEIMTDLRNYLNERRELRAYIVSASIYPLIVLVVSLMILGVLLGVIIPRFANVLTTAGAELSGPAELLFGVSALVRRYWWAALLAMAAIIVLFARLRRHPRVAEQIDAWALKLPGLRILVLDLNLSRLARTMSIMLRSGAHLLNAISVSARVLQNRSLRQALRDCPGELRRGERLADALARVRYIPPFMIQMLLVGEETGNVAIMLERTADRFETELRRTVQRSLSLVEPAVIVLLGLLVGGIVVTMFLAIMEMQSGI